MEAARKRSEIIARSGRELNEIISSGYRERDAIRSASHDKVIHAIRGTEEYTTSGSDMAVHLCPSATTTSTATGAGSTS